jgi:hypothetical protein
MKLKKWFLLIPCIFISCNFIAKTVVTQQAENPVSEQEIKPLVPVYIWPIYVSPLTLVEKDEFFTLAKIVEDETSPGHFKIYPLFGVPTETIKIPEALQEYFSFKIPPSNPEKLLIGLKKIELPLIEQHYLIPVKELDDLIKIKEQSPETNSIIVLTIPEDKQEFEAQQQKFQGQNITFNPNTSDFLASFSNSNNYIQVEQIKDYIRQIENSGQPEHESLSYLSVPAEV